MIAVVTVPFLQQCYSSFLRHAVRSIRIELCVVQMFEKTLGPSLRLKQAVHQSDSLLILRLTHALHSPDKLLPAEQARQAVKESAAQGTEAQQEPVEDDTKQAASRQPGSRVTVQRQPAPAPPDAAVNFAPAVGERYRHLTIPPVSSCSANQSSQTEAMHDDPQHVCGQD